MLRLIRFLIFGDAHLHEWEIIEQRDILSRYTLNIIGRSYILKCKHCGDLKEFKAEL